MCLTITVGERGRRVMGSLTTLINGTIMILSMTLFVAGVAIRVKIDKRLELMDDYNPGALPYYLMLAAVLLFFVHLIAVWWCYSAIYPERRSTQHFYFVAVIYAIFIFFWLVVVSLIVMIVHTMLIYNALEEGIQNSMKAYKTDLDSKIRIDRLQLQYECCGYKSHKDWFKISWVNTMYINVLSKEVKPYLVDGEFIKDDVPFSCCSRHAKRACVHHSVGRFSQHEGISGSTLNQEGCTDAVYNLFYKTLLLPTIWLLVIILILQTVDIPVMRLLQTSILTADEMNDPEGETEAYCYKGLGGGGDTRDLFSRKKDKDKDAEKGGKDGEKVKSKTSWFSFGKSKEDDKDDIKEDASDVTHDEGSKGDESEGADDTEGLTETEDVTETEDENGELKESGSGGFFSKRDKTRDDEEEGDEENKKKKKDKKGEKKTKKDDKKKKKKDDKKKKDKKKKADKKEKKKADKKKKKMKKKADKKKKKQTEKKQKQQKKKAAQKRKTAAKKAKTARQKGAKKAKAAASKSKGKGGKK